MSSAGRVFQRPLAELDVVEIALYLADDSEAAARRFLDAVRPTLVRISAFPGAGDRVLTSNLQLQGCRSWAVSGFDNWRIYYRSMPEGIEVVRVLHVARDLDALD
ncbi:MAG TPA: type II toxin-antitoxin system RelE/ParE family toxin [Pirellulaceae bacterium]|jgi:toxin ParE1/3/4|nr:type II toxin-antitoxin system RelE/ParE family toxin [Pirellulaceae bacterium]